MSVFIYKLDRDGPHRCELPPPERFTVGDLATCAECGRWWMREWDEARAHAAWAPIGRRRAWWLRCRFTYRPVLR